MILELHDSEEGNTLFARVNDIDYVYQAEEWIDQTRGKRPVVHWVLKDGDLVVKAWERPEGSTEFPNEVPVEAVAGWDLPTVAL